MSSPGGWSDSLGCYWLEWRPNGPRSLVLALPELNSPDMGRTIRAALAMDPTVHTVTVESGGEVTGCYQKHDGEWVAHTAAPSRTLRLVKA